MFYRTKGIGYNAALIKFECVFAVRTQLHYPETNYSNYHQLNPHYTSQLPSCHQTILVKMWSAYKNNWPHLHIAPCWAFKTSGKSVQDNISSYVFTANQLKNLYVVTQNLQWLNNLLSLMSAEISLSQHAARLTQNGALFLVKWF